MFKINLDFIYPIGSIYITTNTISPVTLFGGTWEKIENRFLLGASSTYKVNTVGGSTNAQANVQIFQSGGSGYLDLKSSDTSSGVSYQCNKRLQTGTGGAYYGDNFEWQSMGIQVTNLEDTSKLIPPYYAVYIWRRTA